MKATAKDSRQPDARRARALRPRTAGRRRLLAADGLPGQGRLRAGRRRDAAGRRHALAPARHAAGDARRRRRRGQDAGPCATSTATCWPSSTSRRSTPTTRRPRRRRLRLDRREAPGRRLPEPPARPLRRRPARGAPHPAALRLRRAAPDARAASRALRVARLVEGRRLPDPQPAAPGPRGADQARGRADRRRPADPPGRRRDQARRRRPLHPRPLLPGPGRQLLRARLGRPEPAAAGDADGRPARGPAARDHPPQPRLHPLHRRPRPRRARQRQHRQAVLRALRRPGGDGAAQGRDRHGDGRLQADGLPARREPLQPGRRGPRRRRRRPTSRAPRSATTTWPRACNCPSGSAARPSPRSSTRPTRPGSARA